MTVGTEAGVITPNHPASYEARPIAPNPLVCDILVCELVVCYIAVEGRCVM